MLSEVVYLECVCVKWESMMRLSHGHGIEAAVSYRLYHCESRVCRSRLSYFSLFRRPQFARIRTIWDCRSMNMRNVSRLLNTQSYEPNIKRPSSTTIPFQQSICSRSEILMSSYLAMCSPLTHTSTTASKGNRVLSSNLVNSPRRESPCWAPPRFHDINEHRIKGYWWQNSHHLNRHVIPVDIECDYSFERKWPDHHESDLYVGPIHS